METVGILGLGEVGKSVRVLAEKTYKTVGRDVNIDEFSNAKIDILHICIPYTNAFLESVEKTIIETKPSLVIIDSSVKPGTTRELAKRTSVPVVHTPIDGVHPHLAEYQKKFTKAIGALDDASFEKTKTHWLTLGAPKVVRFDSPEDSELAKLLSTTYYGWNIVFNKIVHRLCQKTGTNFDQVYAEFNTFYNEGYADTLPHVRRPVLKYVAGPIGGHCVIPNLHLLQEMYDDENFEYLLQFNDESKSE